MRIRTIKPEFWTDEKTGTLSPVAALLFIAMLNFADDKGRLRGSPYLLKAQAFPYKPEIDIESALAELLSAQLVRSYRVGGQSYLEIINFLKHQKIDRPSKSNQMPEPQLIENIQQNTDSPSTHRVLTEDSTRTRRVLDEDSSTEGKGREGKVKDLNLVAVATVADATLAKPKKSKPTESDETKERRKSLLAKAAALFSSVRGQPYVHQGAKDNVALKSIMAHSDDSEILRRFEAGLRLDRWPRIDSIAQLRSNWNSLAALPAQSATVHNLTFSQREQLEQEERRKAEREKQKRLEAKLEADRKVEWWEPLERGEIWDMWFQRQQELEAAGEFEKLAPTYQRQKKG